MFQSKYQCPDCGSSDAYRSRRRTFLEKYIFSLFLLRPVRCANCFLRTNASLFVPAREREHKPAVNHHAAA